MSSVEASIDCEKITTIEQSYGCRMMVFPQYKSLLNFDNPKLHPLVIKASINQEPVGLLVGLQQFSSSCSIELVSLFVQPDFRHQKVAEKLLIEFEKQSKLLAIDEINVTYMTGQKTTPYLEKLFSKRFFSVPETRMLVVRCSLDSIKPIPWLNRYSLSDDYQIKPWVDLTQNERLEIEQSNRVEHWIADDLIPFNYEQGIEPITSLALLVGGKVRGWCLNHVVAGRLRFTCGFTHIKLQKTGKLTLLLSHIAKVMPATGLFESMWTVPVALHPRMAKFMLKHAKPYSTFYAETKMVSKSIQ
jgi:hypothetical protein